MQFVCVCVCVCVHMQGTGCTFTGRGVISHYNRVPFPTLWITLHAFAKLIDICIYLQFLFTV